jgi:hypothetical protein
MSLSRVKLLMTHIRGVTNHDIEFVCTEVQRTCLKKIPLQKMTGLEQPSARVQMFKCKGVNIAAKNLLLRVFTSNFFKATD